jgi:hypothetical protein
MMFAEANLFIKSLKPKTLTTARLTQLGTQLPQTAMNAILTRPTVAIS